MEGSYASSPRPSSSKTHAAIQDTFPIVESAARPALHPSQPSPWASCTVARSAALSNLLSSAHPSGEVSMWRRQLPNGGQSGIRRFSSSTKGETDLLNYRTRTRARRPRLLGLTSASSRGPNGEIFTSTTNAVSCRLCRSMLSGVLRPSFPLFVFVSLDGSFRARQIFSA